MLIIRFILGYTLSWVKENYDFFYFPFDFYSILV